MNAAESPNDHTAAVEECLALLEAMHSSQGWGKPQVTLYSLVLSAWPADLCRRAVQHAVLNLIWRPAPAELRAIAARLESPVPDRDSALAEVLHLVRRFGLNAAPHPDFPGTSIRTEGPPPFSHPLIGAAVRRCGGWEAICAGDAQMQEGGLSGHFKGNYDRAQVQWEEKVTAALSSGQRPAELFPAWTPFDAVSLESESRRAIARAEEAARPALPAPAKMLSPMPADLFTRHVADGMKPIPTQTHSRPVPALPAVITAEERAEAEEELRQMRARHEERYGTTETEPMQEAA